MIRRMGEGDLEAVAAIWLDANREAHDFIPASYWLGHFEEVRTALAQAEVWVFEAEARAEISGFIGLQEDYIAGIFVRREARSGGVGRLVTVDTDGQEIASLDVNEEILSISAAGRYLAVLYMDSVVIYTEELEPYAALEGTDYARSVLMRQDGSALLLAAESAHLFLP